MIDPPVVFKTAVPESPKLIAISGPLVEITGAAGSAIAGETGITDCKKPRTNVAVSVLIAFATTGLSSAKNRLLMRTPPWQLRSAVSNKP